MCLLVPSNNTETSSVDIFLADEVYVSLMLEYMLIVYS